MTSPQLSYTDLINQLRGAMPINAGGYSDDLNRAWIAAQQQQGAAALQAATQIQLQNQTNQMRMVELMGGQAGPNGQIQSTDAAQRWRSELQAQQDVQRQKLLQDYAQSMGYGVDAQGNLTNQQNLAGRAQTETESARLAANRLQQAEMLGFTLDANGNPTSTRTLAGQRLAQEGDIAAQQRALQERMQGTQYGHETAMQQGLFGQQTALQQGQQQWQSGESLAERNLRLQMQGSEYAQQTAMQQGLFGQQTSERLGTQQFQGQESQYERQLRLQMQAAEYGQQTSERLGTQSFQAGESLAERNARLALQVGQQQWQSGESAQERDLRERLQAGQLNQQEAEFARTYILQQQEGRRQQAALSGQLEGGGLTEAARAARAQETTQRAQLAAQLLNSPKDVFKAGAFFRTLNAGDQANMGFGGGGISGFNGFGNRMQGTGGTLTPGDVYGAVGGGGSGQIGAPQAQATTPGVPAVPTNASGANSPAGGLSDLWGGGGAASAAGSAEATDALSTTESRTGDPADGHGFIGPDETPPEGEPGSEPGGPVGEDTASLAATQLGALGLGNALTKGAPRSAKGRAALLRALEGRGQGKPASQPKGKKADALPAAAQAAALQKLQAQAAAPAGGANPLAAALGAQPPAANPQLEAMRQLLGGDGAPQNAPALPPAPQLPAQAMPAQPPGLAQAALMQSPNAGGMPANAAPVAGLPPQAAPSGIPLGGSPDEAINSAISSVTGAPAAPTDAASLDGLGLDSGGAGAGDQQIGIDPFEMAQANRGGRKAAQGAAAGMGPGGPVGLGDLGLGMNAGGTFPGRVPPDQQGLASQPAAPIPYVDPLVLEDPKVKAMFEDMRRQGLKEAAAAKQGTRNGKKATKVDGAEGGLSHMSDKLASAHAASNERALRGLSRLAQKGALPGMQPAGPVDAPLYPADGGTAPMPQLQDAGSLGGGGASFAAPTGSPTSLDGLGLGGSSGIASVDPYQQAQAQDTMNRVLMGGVGNLGPQELEKMSKTQRGLAEGAAGAAGINWDDLEEAYAQTRFNNVGNALLA